MSFDEVKLEEFFKDEEFVEEMRNFMEGDAPDIPLYYLRSYKLTKALTFLPNYTCVINANGTFLNVFFERLATEVLGPKSLVPFVNMKHLGLLLLFLFNTNPVNFQAFFLMYNLPFILYEYIEYSEIFDVILLSVSPAGAGVFPDFTEEILTRYCMYYKMSRFFADLGELMFYGEYIDEKKKDVNFKPLFIGEIAKVVNSGNSGAAFDIREMGKDDIYSTIEEKTGIKTDVDLILKHFNDMSKKKNQLFRMRSFADQLKDNKRSGFEVEKMRFPGIFETLSKAKERIVFVDYEKIKNRPLFEGIKVSPRGGKSTTNMRVNSPNRLNKKGFLQDLSIKHGIQKRSLDGKYWFQQRFG